MTYKLGLQSNNDCLPIESNSYLFMRLDVSASLSIQQNSKEVGSNEFKGKASKRDS